MREPGSKPHRAMRALLCACAVAALFSGCKGSGTAGGDAHDQQLLKDATAAYLQGRYAALFGSQRSLLEHSKTLLEEVLNDSAASAKTRSEAADMLSKVEIRLDASR